jgi:broad specificity phosphatase PhoE
MNDPEEENFVEIQQEALILKQKEKTKEQERKKKQKEKNEQRKRELAELLHSGAFDGVVDSLVERKKRLRWEHLPEKVILLRHGESEGNINPKVYATRGDSRLELSRLGYVQAREAGARLSRIIGSESVFLAVSPFERALQTCLGVFDGGLSRAQVVMREEPRLREQEFGNLQVPGLNAIARAEEEAVGRFFYRRPNAESSADVYRRVEGFWEDLLSETSSGPRFGVALLIAHGLTIRLLLMVIFQWSISTFESVWNMGNCEHIALQKNISSGRYEFCINDSFPARLPWATKTVRVVFRNRQLTSETQRKVEALKTCLATLWPTAAEVVPAPPTTATSTATSMSAASHTPYDPLRLELERLLQETNNQSLQERSEAFVIVDYLSLPSPRQLQQSLILKRLVPEGTQGTPEQLLELAKQTVVHPEQVEGLDWWGSGLSYTAKTWHMKSDEAFQKLSGL